MITTYYLSPISPSSATSIELGSTREQAEATLREIGYDEEDILALFCGSIVGSVDPEDRGRWKLTF